MWEYISVRRIYFISVQQGVWSPSRQTSCCAVYPVTHIRAWRHVTTGNNKASLEIYKAGDQNLIHSGCSVSLAFSSPTLFSRLSIRIHLIEASTGTKDQTMMFSRIFQHFRPKVPVNHMWNFPENTLLYFESYPQLFVYVWGHFTIFMCCGSTFILTTLDRPLKVELYLSVSGRHTGEWRYSFTHSQPRH